MFNEVSNTFQILENILYPFLYCSEVASFCQYTLALTDNRFEKALITSQKAKYFQKIL